MTWGYIGGAGVAVAGNYLLNSNKGGGGSSQSYYVPTGLGQADITSQDALAQERFIASQSINAADPTYAQSFQQQQGINYQPYAQAGQVAGQQYGQLATQAGQQAAMYGQGAQGAQQAQQQIYQSAFDPQQTLYDRTQGQLQDQVRAGQAARGLGVSGVGAGLEDQAMSNFNIDWQNNQLARQQQGIQGMGQAGQLMGADLTAQQQAGQQQIGYGMQSAQAPIQAQQWAAQQPAQAAQQYQQQMLGSQQMYGNVGSAAIPYMNYGQGAQQQNYQNTSAQNAANTNLLTQLGSKAIDSYNTPGSWMNNAFGGNSPSQGFQNSYTQNASTAYNPTSSPTTYDAGSGWY